MIDGSTMIKHQPFSRTASRKAEKRQAKAKLQNHGASAFLQLQQMIGNQALGQFIQAKLTISQPGDEFEQEADQVAQQVMRMPDTAADEIRISRLQPPTSIQRACSKCEEETDKDERHLQAKSIAGGTSTPSLSETVSAAMKGSGEPLPRATRRFFEPRFGRDFSHVRVHANQEAAAAALSINARAYTIGHDIVFGGGQYGPTTPAGRELIAHELTHTIQQGVSAPVIARKGEDKKKAVAADPITMITLDRTGRRVVMQTGSGIRYSGTAVTDLEPGTYTAKPQPRVGKWVFKDDVRVKPGQRFWIELNPLSGSETEAGPDPWSLSYASEVEIVVGGATPEPVYTGPSVQERINKLTELINNKWTDSDDELAIINMIAEAPPQQAAELLEKLTTLKVGDESYLEALDRVVDGSNNQQLHEALSLLRMKTMTPEKVSFETAPVLPWHDVMGFFADNATFTVERTPKGKYRIRYLGGARLINSTDFRTEVKALPLNLFLGGMEFEPGQVIIVHDYDSGHFVPLTVDQLAGYEHAGIRNFLGHVATVASLAMPVSAARTVAGKAAVVIIERVLPAVTMIIDENRLNIMKWWPNWGPKILKFSDLAKVGMAAYGIVRFAMSSYQLVKNWKQVVGMRKALDGAANPGAEAEQIAASLERQSNQTIAELENIQKAETAAAKAAADEAKTVEKAAEAATDIPKTDPVPTHIEAPPTTVTGTKPPTGEPVVTPAKPEPIIDNPMDNLNDATSKMLSKPENKALKAALEGNQRAARALKRCASACWPDWATSEQIAKIEKIIAEAEEIGAVNYPRLRDALRNPEIKDAKALDAAINQLEKALQEQKALGAHIAGHQELAGQATHFDMSPDAMQLRRTPGIAEGGERLARQGFPWLIQGKVGLFPKQIADRMRGMSFRNFDEFREVFWRLVAEDAELGKAWTKASPSGWKPQSLARMRNGQPPYVSASEATGGGSNAVWNLDHKLSLKNQGEVYNFDNIQIVSPKFHASVGEK